MKTKEETAGGKIPREITSRNYHQYAVITNKLFLFGIIV